MIQKEFKHQYDGMSDIVALIKSEGTDNKFYICAIVQVWNSTNDGDYEEYIAEYLTITKDEFGDDIVSGYIPKLGRTLTLDGLYPEGNLGNDESTYHDMLISLGVENDCWKPIEDE